MTGAALGFLFPRAALRRRWWVLGAVCTDLPDADVVGFRFGVEYGDPLGHRGFTHSLAFAALLAVVLAALLRRRVAPAERRTLPWYLFLCSASHGVLDALTDGGLGVAFFAPFDLGRYFLPWAPIAVAPIGVGHFFTARGWECLASELVAVWVPAAAVVAAVGLARRAAERPRRDAA